MKPISTAAATLLLTLSLTVQAATSPSAPVVQPLPAYTTQTTIAVRGQAQPSVYLFVEGGALRVGGMSGADGAFNLSLPLKRNQRNSLSVFASTDAQGNEHNSPRVQFAIVEDDIAPLITATLDPAPNAAGWHRGRVKVEFHCSDRSGSGIVDCPADVPVNTPGAQQTITGRVTDKAGNQAAVNVVLNIDDSPPVVVLDEPADDTLLYSSPVHLSGTLAESLSGVAAVNCNNVPAIVSGNTFSCDVPLKNGSNAIKVWAIDAAGNIGVARKSLVLGPALPGGDAHQTMVSGHINKHTNTDVVHTDFLTREVSILAGNGDGTFQPERRVLVGPYPSAVALADLDGDGIADLITTHYTTSEVAIQYGRADGGFTPGPRFQVDAFPSALMVADIDGDGRLDLLTAHMLNHQLHLHLRQRDGTFKEQPSFGVGEGPVAIAVGDLDGDGKLDIVTANFTSGDVSLLLGKGKGKFHGEQRLVLTASQAARALSVSANAAPSAIAIADVNGDSLPDIVTANSGTNSVSLLLGAGRGRFQSVRTLAVGQQPLGLAVADVTGDGKLDLITANFGSSDLSVLRGSGSGTFGAEERVHADAAASSLTVVSVGGGTPVLVSGNNSPAVQVVIGNGSGGFASLFSVADAMNAPYAVYLPLIVGPTAGDGVHHSALHLLNAAQQDNDIAITFVDEVSGLGVAQYTGTLRAADAAVLPTIQSRPEGFAGTGPASGFQGAVVISSKRPISASAELVTLNGSLDQYDGVQRGGGSRRIVLPYIAKNVIGYNGTIIVENIGLQPATVHVEYTPGRRGVAGSTAPLTLKPGQSHTFRAADVSIEDASGQFFGAATVLGSSASDQLAVVAIHESRPPLGSESVNVYNGAGDDLRSDTLYAPLYATWHDRNSTTDIYFTTLAITNTGDEDTEVHIATSRNVALPERSDRALCPINGHFVPDTFLVAAGKTRQLGFSNSCKYVGSAVFTSNNGQPLSVAIIEANVSRSAMYMAIPKSATSEEVLLPKIVSQYSVGARYSEIQIQNVDALATQVRIAFAPNRLGGSRPPDMLRQLDPGQTLYIADLARNGIEYLGSATVTTDNRVKLGVVVTELPRDPIDVADPIETYVGRAPPKSKISMNVVRVPDTPLVNPCLPFMEKVRSVRDSPGGSSVYIDPTTINPLFGLINCFQTEDEEHQQRAQAQGLLLTRELPAFARMDPVIGPLPGLLINTDPFWANHSTSDQASFAVIGTSGSSAKSRLVMSDPWAQVAAALAQTMATAAAAALGQGAGDAMVDHLRQWDWINGPTDLIPSGPSPLDQRTELKGRLVGLGAVSDNGEEANVNRLIASALNSAEATTGNPGPGPDFPCDAAGIGGFISAETLGIASDFNAFGLHYSELGSVSRGFMRFSDLQPRQEGALNLCKLMRTFAACMRARGLNEMEISHQPGILPQSAVDFLNQHWSGGHLVNPISGLEKWVINVRDRNQRGFSCLFD